MPVIIMLLYECLPNHKMGSIYSYNEESGNLAIINGSKVKGKINGWLVSFRDFSLRKHIVIIFAKNNHIFVDFGRGARNFYNEEIVVKFHKIVNLLYLKVHLIKEGIIDKYIILIPPWRYFFNDGMFPDEVEPVYGIFKDLNDKEQREIHEKELSEGKRF